MRGEGGRRLFLLVLLTGVGAFAVFWYAHGGSSEVAEPEFGGRYVEGVAGVPQRVNPLFANQNDVDAALAALVFAGLTRLDDAGRPFPDLASTWTVSPDGRTYTFELRPGLLWQDGTPLTADDVIFTYRLLNTPGLRTTLSLASLLAGAQLNRPDPRHVVISLPEAYAPLPAFLTLGILPAHILRNLPPDALAQAPFNQQPVGAGPYRLEELTPTRAALVANPGYHAGQPFLQRFEMRFFRDESLLLAALKNGEANAGLVSSIVDEDARDLEQRRHLALRTLPSSNITYVYFNLDGAIGGDRRVRQALLYALDRDALLQVVPGAQRVDSVLPPATWAYSPALERYGFDPNLASLLLEEAGWRAVASGPRLKGGRPLALKLATSTDPVHLALAKAIGASWQAAGIDVDISTSGTTELIRETIPGRAFDALIFETDTGPDPDPYAFWHSSRTRSHGLNVAGLKDQRIDALIDEARTAAPVRRDELYGQLQELFAQEVPAIPLFGRTLSYLQPDALRGGRAGFLPEPGARFWQVQEWHLRTR